MSNYPTKIHIWKPGSLIKTVGHNNTRVFLWKTPDEFPETEPRIPELLRHQPLCQIPPKTYVVYCDTTWKRPGMDLIQVIYQDMIGWASSNHFRSLFSEERGDEGDNDKR